MTKSVIKVQNLGKKYKIGLREPYYSLRDSVANLFKKKKPRDEFCALQGINFEVKEGEVLGIIGPNGAGKSTLLKVISRITPPTTGRVLIQGKIASLLEVGTGFHPELTGRENIYLSGAVLGMSRAEISKKFNQIVEFSGISQFIDTPVKRYSSGMYVRLAFSVAAHLEPDILIIDEVLAVGDANFQKKCLGKMGEVSQGGRTVLLVSHNMHSILSLSSRCLFLSKGKLIQSGEPEKVVKAYRESASGNSQGKTNLTKAAHYGDGSACFTHISLRDPEGNPIFVTGCNIEVELTIKAYENISNANVAIVISDEQENRLIDVNTLIKGYSLDLKKKQQAKVIFLLKNVRLQPGVYTVAVWMGAFASHEIDAAKYASSFEMEARREDVLYTSPFPGVYACEFDYKIKKDRGKGI
ncbi:MAG: ABC transporter related protein [Berkelbacteria bacterium GW2011_GWA1_36_9]|uniref:ABC transporter related protein n=1 Tax=Berkelbacteria bacterium GW2011_GWA1_36_9 TaxID=1618331 RepID=A0A0G0FY96_9BACT|nr:MAG: ABC transporter related protein [Berkelbacteria bacterium GW2011_GWA1_36_9]